MFSLLVVSVETYDRDSDLATAAARMSLVMSVAVLMRLKRAAVEMTVMPALRIAAR